MNRGPTHEDAQEDDASDDPRPALPRALLVHDRRFSEIGRLAETVAGALAGDFDVHVSACVDVDPASCSAYEVLVVGNETRGEPLGDFEGAVADVRTMRDWLERVPPAAGRRYAAAYEIRAAPRPRPLTPPSHATLSILHERGYLPLSRQTFFLSGANGAVGASEHLRARAWARSLAGRIDDLT